jgi:hypothetical protein
MFFEMAIGLKAIVVVVSLIGLFLGLFPEIDLWPSTPRADVVVEATPEVDTVWAALVHAPDSAARDDVKEVSTARQATARQADDNAVRIALYAAHSETVSTTLQSSNRLLFWAMLGLCAVAFPLPKRHTGIQREERA